MRRFLCFNGPVWVVAWACATASGGPLIISEIVDSTLPGGLPKFVELTNTGSASIDLSLFSIGNFNNGNLELGGGVSTILSGTIAAGDSYVISYENGDSPGNGTFFDTYLFDPDFFGPGAVINGDDAVALFAGLAVTDGFGNLTGTVVDVYGIRGVDGTSEIWEYTDSYAVRNPGVMTGTSTFNAAEWTFGGTDFLETGDDPTELALILANTTPGTHRLATTAVPEPSALALAGTGLLGILALGWQRRRHRI
ncbi:MAG: lamin tail domain-containing protein [Planctomycetaceae bacterium]